MSALLERCEVRKGTRIVEPQGRTSEAVMLAPAHIQHVLASAEGALPLISNRERQDATRMVNICQGHWTDSKVVSVDLKEVGALIEVLARRSAQAMPFAALGRALVAELKGDSRFRDETIIEFQAKLAQLGL